MSSIAGTASVTAGVSGTLAVGGNQATNNNVSSNVDPVLIAGSDYGGTPKIQSLKVDSSGFGHITLEAGSNSVGTVVLGAGSAKYGQVAIDQTTPGSTNAVQQIPGTTGGLSWYFVQPTASDNHAVIKNGAGQVYEVVAFNNSATVNYLRLYNAGTGFNGCNSASNLKGQFQIPALTTVGGFVVPIPPGVAFSTGISICVTSGYSTTDTTNATATAMSVNVLYD
jgi:hypothetical protein